MKLVLEQFVGGRYVNMDMIVVFSKRVVVGHIEHAKVNRSELIDRVNTNWLLEFGIAP